MAGLIPEPQTPSQADPDGQVEQEPQGADPERQDQAGNYQRVGDSQPSCVANLPASDEQIESEIVKPAGNCAVTSGADDGVDMLLILQDVLRRVAFEV